MIAIKLPASTRKTPRTVQHLALAARYSKRAWHQLIGGWVKPLENIQKNDGKSPCYQWVNQRWILPCSIANCLITRGYLTIHYWSRVKQLFQGWFIGFRNHPHVRHSTRGWMESSIQFPGNPYKGFLFHIPQYGHTILSLIRLCQWGCLVYGLVQGFLDAKAVKPMRISCRKNNTNWEHHPSDVGLKIEYEYVKPLTILSLVSLHSIWQ